jgi:hypothetical protein
MTAYSLKDTREHLKWERNLERRIREKSRFSKIICEVKNLYKLEKLKVDWLTLKAKASKGTISNLQI